MRRLLPLVATLALVAGCGGDGHAGAPRPVRIAAASNLQPALDQLLPDLPVEAEVSYGSSGQLLRQVLDGAPFDVLLSADDELAERAAREGRAAPEDVFAFASGRLALWAPKGSPVDPGDGLAGLADEQVRRVAVANPAHVPYGRAAVAALDAAGVGASLSERLVLGESVAQALELARSGGADAAVVALSLVVAPVLAGEGRWTEVPDGTYPPVEQAGVLLAGAHDRDAAEAVRDALRSDAGQALLSRHGYRPAA